MNHLDSLPTRMPATLTLMFVVVVTACSPRAPVSPGDVVTKAELEASRGLTVLAINDVYRIEGVDGGTEGGLGRVRALRERLEGEGEEVLLLHAGDFLFPSFLSRSYDGAQMVDVMNRLDGAAGRFDERMFVTFGNHEFDKASLRHAAGLDARIEESEFTWLDTNIEFADGDDGAPLIAATNLTGATIVDIAGTRVGLFSLSTDEKAAAYVERFVPPVVAARQALDELRGKGVDLIVALTHLTMPQDLALLEALGDEGPDLVIGGHEHETQAEQAAGRWVLKADAEARTAYVVRLARPAPAAGWQVAPTLVELAGDSPPPDPAIAARVAEWQRRHEREACAELGAAPDCLEAVLGRTSTRLVGEELSMRRYESNLGDWIADRMLEAFAERGAQAAFVNSGSLRLNQNVPADSDITRRHVEEVFAYPAPLVLLRIDGATLQRAVERSIEGWTGNGWFLQVAGFAFRHDPRAETATDLTLLTASGARPIDAGEELLVVTTQFLVDPAGGQDGYTMLTPDQVVATGPDLKELVVAGLQRAGAAGIAPLAEGRICNASRAGATSACLAVSR